MTNLNKKQRKDSNLKKKKPSMRAQKKFHHFYVAYRTDMFWYIRRKLNSNELAEDFTADLFMKLLEHEDVLLKRKDSGVKAWLYTVARNMVIDYYRKNARPGAGQVELTEEVFEIVSQHDDEHLKGVINDEKIALLNASLEILSPGEQELVSLRFRDEFKFAEIAKIIGKEEGAIKMQLYRAIEKLKDHMGDRL